MDGESKLTWTAVVFVGFGVVLEDACDAGSAGLGVCSVFVVGAGVSD